ncbi:MAG: hypothetical protein ACOVMP_04315 [Chthoniobacterales bacterium]
MGFLIAGLTTRPPSEPFVSMEGNPTDEPSGVAPEEMVVRFDSPTVPSSLSIESEGVEIARINSSTFGEPLHLPLLIPAEGLDLVVQASWNDPNSKSHALRIQIDLPTGSEIDTTLWGNTSVADVITIPGKESR